jgi:hypothetical protein
MKEKIKDLENELSMVKSIQKHNLNYSKTHRTKTPETNIKINNPKSKSKDHSDNKIYKKKVRIL